MKFPEELLPFQKRIDEHLLSISQNRYGSDDKVHSACRYALEAPGKRIRPLLTVLANQACEGDINHALSPAVAVEMIHTYSLIRDDLPCMDDDDFRRGRPTTHKEFGEATALLAGDALLTDSFHEATIDEGLPATDRLSIARCLSEVSGGSGMVRGQESDMCGTGKPGYQMEDLNRSHLNKTGKLIAGACKVGAHSASAPQEACQALYEFGLNLGIAFQILDDLLDGEEGTGKSQGKDLEQGKLTYLAIMEKKQAKELAEEYTERAFAALKPLGDKKQALESLGKALLSRTR